LHDFKVNRGKTAVQNDLVARSKGEILVFTDAASFLLPDAIQKIVRNFADVRVRCTAENMRFVNTDSNLTAQSQGIYWRYEAKIRAMESRLGSLIGVDGPLYAVRRDCYVPLAHNLISDFLTPLIVLSRNKRVVLDPEAIVDEDPTRNTGQEFATRRRITLRALVGLSAYPGLLNLFKRPMPDFQILFHKLLRWFVGPMVALNFLACILLTEFGLFKVFLVCYMLFFFAAGLGWLADRCDLKVKALAIPYYFGLVNLAATAGIIDFFRKKHAASWVPVRQ
jgi:cellulose synthase/poly-beta-1,6-N-acetylglucosamine synthase-like glycosyltransferase